jgi:L,D-transpeptidase catalytic domain
VSGRTVGATAFVAAAVGAVLMFGLLRTESKKDATALPAPVEPAFRVPQPTVLASVRDASRWASVRRAATARSALGPRAAIVGRLETRTPEGTTNLVLVLGHAIAHGRVWVRIRLPVLPNNTTGWVPREALGGQRVVETRLVVDRRTLTATLFRNGRRVFSAPVGIGQPQWPTPAGEFYIRNRLRGFESPFYGPLAFGTSARSSVLTDWPAGGFVGIHGTDRPDLLPGRVSHGCIRMRNDDILELGRLMPIGTPLTIR